MSLPGTTDVPPGPLLRRGPRPLLLHLMLAMLKSSSSVSGSQTLSGAWPGLSNAAAEQARTMAEAVQRAAAGQPGAFPQAVLMEALRQDRELIAGIAAYRRHPWRRDLPDPPALWSEGGSRLLNFSADAAPQAPTLLLVPSLVNRASLLDLAPGRSMARFLAGQGLRVLLLDWGWPGETERSFSLTDYIAGRLERALVAVGGRVVLAG